MKAVLSHRQAQFEQATVGGYTAQPVIAPGYGEGGAISPSMVLGGYPQDEIDSMLEMGDPRNVGVFSDSPQSLQAVSERLWGRPLTDAEIARLAGALDGADVVATIQDSGLLLEMRNKEARALHWIGPDQAGILKVHVHRTDITTADRNQGRATRLLARTIQQASRLGVQYADATAMRSATDGGYYALARYGFDAPLPRPWLTEYAAELKAAGLAPHRLADLMATAEGRKIWRLHGQTVDVKMELRPGAPDIFRFAWYVEDRRRKGRPMSEGVKRECDYPIYGHGLTITEEDEEILDRVWAKIPVTEAEHERKREFERIIRPGTRAPMPDDIRQIYEREMAESEARRKAGLPSGRYKFVGHRAVEI